MKRYLILWALLVIGTASSAQWIEKAKALKKRSETASVVYNGKIYTFLGFRDAALNTEPTVEVYDPVKNTWTLLKSIDSAKSMTHQGLVLIDDNVWHIGGRVGQNPGAVTQETWIYNITRNSWSKGPDIIDPATNQPLKLGGGGAALLGRTIHLFGGFVNTGCNGDQNKYHLTLNVDDYITNPATAKWKNELAPLPIPRNHFSTVVMGGKIYALGGQFGHDCSGGADQKISHEYNPVTNTWRTLAALALPRSHAEAGTFVCDGKIYIAAGQSAGPNNKNSCDRVTTYDVKTNKWFEDSVVLKLPAKYEGLSAKVVDTRFIISHGGEGASNYTRNTTFSRTIQRSYLDSLVFSNDTLTLNVVKGDVVSSKTWLSSYEGNKNFTIAKPKEIWFSLKDSLGIATPNAKQINFTVNSAQLNTGTYYVNLAASYKRVNSSTAFARSVVRINVTGTSAVKISMANVRLVEDATSLALKIDLDKTSSGQISVDYVTEHITTSAQDLTLKNGTVTFAPGILSQTITLTGLKDDIDEEDETFRIKLSNAKNATIATPVAIATIADNDAAPTVSIYDSITSESTGKAVLRIALNKPSGKTVKILYDTKNATALSGSDYTGVANGSISFAPLEMKKDVTIVVQNDNVQESTETFQVIIKSPENSTMGNSTATVSLYNGSTQPSNTIVLEAESAAVFGASIQSVYAGYSGTGYVDYENLTNDYIEWTVNPGTAGTYNLKFRYANAGANNRPLQLMVNGRSVNGSLAFNPTGDWSTWSITSANATLIGGINKVRLTAVGSSGPIIDNLSFTTTATATQKLTSKILQPFSPMISDSFDLSVSLLKNPVRGNAQLILNGRIDQEYNVQLMDATGKTKNKMIINKGTTYYDFPVAGFARGTYMILVEQGTRRKVIRMIVE